MKEEGSRAYLYAHAQSGLLRVVDLDDLGEGAEGAHARGAGRLQLELEGLGGQGGSQGEPRGPMPVELGESQGSSDGQVSVND